MNKQTLWRLLVIAAVVLICVISATPLNEKIHLGLDLQGGMHLIYEVDADKAVVSSLDNLTEDLKKFLKNKKIGVSLISREAENIVVRLNGAVAQKAMDAIDDDYPILELTSQDLSKGLLTYAYTPDHRDTVYKNAISQALETLRNRIDQFGVSEPTIQREGENRILIQLPGIKDRKRAINLIGKTARLEFRMLDEGADPSVAIRKGAPPGDQLLYEKQFDPITKKVTGKIPYLVKKKVELTGGMLSNAEVRISQMNMPYVSIDFNKEGSRIFARLTTENVGKRMAIVLDDSVYSAPVIRERITGGSAMIEGSFSHEEARDLAIVLRAGSLPAPLIKLEERSVGPSLGHDSISRGINSIIIGGIIVFVFMLLYYRLGGVIADIALGLNIVILAGALAYFGATLTLPGIAGIILTIGMAVDANVLVFERIREEIRNGKTIRSAVDSGFGKAFLTIIDANVTTLIAALVLFQFGTGPVKGFAVTLTIGIVASLFTAIFVSRTLFSWYLGSRRVTELNI
ncbi:Protein translocase subunit SecD [hydrothermal vent metagenome]|uniref:Protein translocase subunit SecD n=1 Tax=hydrothermal vent metagenome TaxID=652676 RepID=A0A3B1D0A7_9ZZZZ